MYVVIIEKSIWCEKGYFWMTMGFNDREELDILIHCTKMRWFGSTRSLLSFLLLEFYNELRFTPEHPSVLHSLPVAFILSCSHAHYLRSKPIKNEPIMNDSTFPSWNTMWKFYASPHQFTRWWPRKGLNFSSRLFKLSIFYCNHMYRSWSVTNYKSYPIDNHMCSALGPNRLVYLNISWGRQY
jgi:hypothetical protein